MKIHEKIFVTGHSGMVGSAILRHLKELNYQNLIVANRSELDLQNQHDVLNFIKKNKPQIIILAAARVGGIAANKKYPADFLFENLAIQNNIYQAALKNNVKKVIFLGSSCIYPANSPQPMKESLLLTGPLEPTNEAYAIAKIAGLKMAQYFYEQYGLNSLSLMPCNLYGTNDHFDLEKAHVLSSLVRRFVDAVDNNDKTVTLWGTGVARREFMHVDDLARAVLYLDDRIITPDFINVGSGEDISILDLAILVAELSEFKGAILWDHTKPDGMLKKLLDVSSLNQTGFCCSINLKCGINKTIKEYKYIKNHKLTNH